MLLFSYCRYTTKNTADEYTGQSSINPTPLETLRKNLLASRLTNTSYVELALIGLPFNKSPLFQTSLFVL